jgi:hypothetical protein
LAFDVLNYFVDRAVPKNGQRKEVSGRLQVVHGYLVLYVILQIVIAIKVGGFIFTKTLDSYGGNH